MIQCNKRPSLQGAIYLVIEQDVIITWQTSCQDLKVE